MPNTQDYQSDLQKMLAQHEPACSLRLFNRPARPMHFEGFIVNLQEIHLGYDGGWKWRWCRPLRAFCAARQVAEPIRLTLESLLDHEVNHRHVCPGNEAMGHTLYVSVAEALRPHGKSALSGYVSNLLSDLLVNARTARDSQAASNGLFIFYLDSGLAVNSGWRAWLKIALRRAWLPYTPHFAIFTATQLALFGSDAARQMLGCYIPNDPAVLKATQALIELFRDPALWEATGAERWPALFHQATEIMATFLPDVPPPTPTSAPQPWLNPNDPDEADRYSSPTWYDPESGQVCGDKQLPGADANRQKQATLDSFYRHEAKKQLSLRQRESQPPPARMPAALSNLVPTEIVQQTLEKWRKIEHVAIAMDASNSMSGSPDPAYVPWGRNSNYHHALVALYRLVKWLEIQPHEIQLNVLAFSDQTRSTGWFAARDFSSTALGMIFGPWWGATYIDPQVLKSQIEAAPGGVLLFILSDGAIANVDDLVAVLRELRPRCLPRLLLATDETGDNAAMCQAMRSAGFQVQTRVALEQVHELILDDIEANIP